MSRPKKFSDDEIIRFCKESKSIRSAAKKAQCDPCTLRRRIKQLKPMYGDITPTGYYPEQRHSRKTETFHRDKPYTIVAFSDAHFWPEYLSPMSPANKVLLKVLDDIKPDIILDNGDSFDGASISRFPKNRAQIELPTVAEELEINETRHEEIRSASPKSLLHWNFGNHDNRYSNYILINASEIYGLPGTELDGYFPDWDFFDSIIYNDTLLATHQWKGGMGAGRNNALNAGKSVLTGHTHRLTQTPITDLNGTRWGLESGTLADPRECMFNYTLGITDWQPGFMVITIDGGQVHPEAVFVNHEGKAHFRGKSY